MDARDIDKVQQDFRQWLFRHVVLIAGTYYQLDDSRQRISDPLPFTYSGFIMSFEGVWFLVTAGHVIDTLDNFLKHRNIEIEEFSLIDYLGLNPTDRHPIPFDYGGSQRYACDDEAAGLDFGLIRLSPLYQELLAVNVTPVHDKNWLLQREDETFLGYLMLGVPDEYVTRGLTVGVMGETIVGMAGSAILALRRLDSPPEWAKQTRYRRFVAEIMNPGDLTSITGMSSGPILGFAEKEGRHYYRVIAIQSSQDPRNERIVYGCLIRSFGQNILDCMNSLLREEV